MNELDTYLYNLELIESKDIYCFEELDVSEFMESQEAIDEDE